MTIDKNASSQLAVCFSFAELALLGLRFSGRKVQLARPVTRTTFCVGGQPSARNARRQQPWNVRGNFSRQCETNKKIENEILFDNIDVDFFFCYIRT